MAIRKHLGLPPGALVVGAFGSAPTGRRAAVVLDAFRDLYARRPDAQLLIVSTDAIPAPPAAPSDGPGWGGRVRALGRRSIVERDELMAAVDVAVLSQAPGPFDTPTPMLAMLLAAGVPTILDEPGDLDSDLKPFVRRYDWTEEGSAGPAGPTDGDRGGTGGGAGPGRLGAGGRRPLPGLGPGGGLIRGADRACHGRRPRSARPPDPRARSPRHPVPLG